MADPIGEIPIQITGDYSGLADDFAQAQSIATDAATNIAGAFTSAATNADNFSGKIQDLSGKADDASTSIGGIQTALGNLDLTGATTDAENLGSQLGGVSSAVTTLGGDATTAASNVGDLGSALNDIGDQSGDLTSTASAIEGVGSSAGGATSSVHEFAGEVGSAGEEGGSANEVLLELFPTMLAFGGIASAVEVLKDFASECLDIANQEEKTQVALTALTGNAGTAAESIEGLKEIALSDALTMPQLLTADQRMVALGIDIQSTPALLQAAADAAAATGRGFDQVTSAIDRMVLSGTAGARQLANLGISSSTLAASMGVDAGNMAAAFKEMDPSDRVTVIEGALSRFQGVAQDMAQTVGGQMTTLQTEFEIAMGGIGQAIAPAASALLSFVQDTIVPMVDTSVQNFQQLSGAVQSFTSVAGQIDGAVQNFVGLTGALQDNAPEVDNTSRAVDGLNHSILDMPQVNWTNFLPGTQFLQMVAGSIGQVTNALELMSGKLPQLAGNAGNANSVIDKSTALITSLGTQLQSTGGAAVGFSANAQAIANNIAELQGNVTSCQKEVDDLTAAQKLNSNAMVEGVPIATTLMGANNNLALAQKALDSALGLSKNSGDAWKGTAADILTEVTALKTPSDAVTQAMADLKAKFDDGTISAGTFMAAVKDLGAAANTSINTMNSYIGVEATLVAKQDDAKAKVDTLTAAMLDLAQKGFESTSPVMQQVISDLSKALQAADMDLSDIGLDAGTATVQVIAGGKQMSTAVTDVKTQLGNVVDSMQQVGDTVTSVTSSASGHLKQTVVDFGDVNTAVGTVTTSLGNQVGAFGNTSTAASSAVKIITGSDGEAAAATAIDVATGKVINQGTKWGTTGQASGDSVKTTVGALTSQHDPAVDTSAGKVDALGGKWPGTSTATGSAATASATALSGTLDPAVDSSAKNITDQFGNSWDMQSQDAQKSADAATASLNKEQGDITQGMDTLEGDVADNFQGMSDAADSSRQASTASFSTEKSDIASLASGLETAVTGNFGNMAAAADKSRSDSTTSFSTAQTSIEGLMSGLEQSVKGNFQGMAGAAQQSASDSTTAVNGIKAATDALSNSIGAITSAALPGLSTAFGTMASNGTSSVNQVKSALDATGQIADTVASSKIPPVTNALNNANQSAQNLGSSISNVGTTGSSAFGQAATACESLDQQVKDTYGNLDQVYNAMMSIDILGDQMQVKAASQSKGGGGGMSGQLGFTGTPAQMEEEYASDVQLMQQMAASPSLGINVTGVTQGIQNAFNALQVSIANYNAANPTAPKPAPTTSGGGGGGASAGGGVTAGGTMMVQDQTAESLLSGILAALQSVTSSGSLVISGAGAGGTIPISGGALGAGGSATTPTKTATLSNTQSGQVNTQALLQQLSQEIALGQDTSGTLAQLGGAAGALGSTSQGNPNPGLGSTPITPTTATGGTVTVTPPPGMSQGGSNVGGTTVTTTTLAPPAGMSKGTVDTTAVAALPAGTPTAATLGAGSPSQTMLSQGLSTQSIQSEIAQLIASGMSAQQASTMNAGQLSAAVGALGTGPAAGNTALTPAQSLQFQQLAAQLGVSGMPTAPTPTAPTPTAPGTAGSAGAGGGQGNVVNIYNPTVTNATMLDQLVTQVQNAGTITQ